MPLKPTVPTIMYVSTPTECAAVRYEIVGMRFYRSSPETMEWTAEVIVAACCFTASVMSEVSRSSHIITATDLDAILSVPGDATVARVRDLERAILTQLVAQGSLPEGVIE